MRYLTIITSILTIISVIALLCSQVWCLIGLFTGENNKLAWYSFITSLLLMLLMFKLSIIATDKEIIKEINEYRQQKRSSQDRTIK